MISRQDPVTGQRQRVTKYAANKSEASRKLREVKENAEAGVSSTDTPLAHYLVNDWLPTHAATKELRPGTVFIYGRIISEKIVPHIGDVTLADFKPANAEALLKTLRAAGNSQCHLNYVWIMLSSAYKKALRLGMVAHNPMVRVDKPTRKLKQFEVWTSEEANQFMARTEGERLAPLFVLALSTGMRQGELLGLRWEDIDFAKKELTVRRQLTEERAVVDGKITRELKLVEPKTDAGKRTFKLSAMCVSALTKQKALLLREGFARSGMVFVNSRGGYMLKTGVIKAFRAAAKAAGVKVIRFHDMRHTNATGLISGGMNPRTVADRLGHSDPSVTLKVYAKYSKQADEKAAEMVDAMFQVGV